MQDLRTEISEITEQLREHAQRQDPIARAVVKLFHLLREDAKERLVSAAENDMLRRQGEARAFDRVYHNLIHNPPSIKSGEQ